MGITRREPRASDTARTAGFDAAVGLLSRTRRERRPTGRTCSHCGAEARLDMIDMPRTRVYLTCTECGNTWDTDRMHVSPRTAR